MEHFNILLKFLVVLSVVLITIPDDAGGYQILNYDEESPAYPWEHVMQLEKRLMDAANQTVDDLTTTVYPHREKKRIFDFEENLSNLKKYGKESGVPGVRIVYGRISKPVIVVLPRN